MINYIPRIYDDELFYSFVARYSEISGDTNLKNILKDFFGSKTITPYVQFPCNISKFCSSVFEDLNLNADIIISGHTMFPIYEPFLTTSRKKEILEDMKFSNGQRIGFLLGIQAGAIFSTKELKYCPLCVREDVNSSGEAYFHRGHQVDGILVCHKHGCKIKTYTYGKDNYISRLKYISLNPKYTDKDVNYYNEQQSAILLKIAKAAFLLLKNSNNQYEINIINKKYKVLLKQKGLLTISREIRQDKTVRFFKMYYGDEILNIMNLNFNVDSDSSWIRNILRNNKRIINPIKHIMLILFLCDNMNTFLKKPEDEYEYFGNGPWPCLNPVSDHYREKVIKNVKITADYKTRLPIGTFNCSCGFKYSRKGPDNHNEHIYEIGRIKCFGHVWESQLLSIACAGSKSVREICRIMRCDAKTVKKYIDKIENGYIKISDSVKKDYDISNFQNKRLLKYRNNLISFIKENSDLTRTEIRRIAQKEYTWLYRNDKEWLFENLPQKTYRVKMNRNKVEWEPRDNEVLILIKNAYNDIVNSNKPIRITKSRLGNVAGISSLIYNKKSKLPKTQKFISNMVESIDKFHIRKVNYIYNNLIKQQGYVRKWQILKQVARNPSVSVKFYIDECFRVKKDKLT
ncbi:hypothetical protein CLHOM_19180 [Clostridium homopropionicum DSM 5847]|uniref:Uncharacterized protein n=1 Tax=Clostridium homopropionicum DSM 5847 TaxID=1121318 RepID=A0A0L6ZA31_9CLOT|nr:TnsD family Tn7-like transposition protein [Clostridium homopropionicum]KOA19829.1 hypothetical protein CLHOM_19180 [Clostridium homopropionicum DSM 5847]SFF76528.1 TniQ protein [Clostridium homopropionicum]